MGTDTKINIKLKIEKGFNTELELELVEYISKTEIPPYTKLVGRVKGDDEKIVFGARRDKRTIIFQIYDFLKPSTKDIVVIDKYAYLVTTQNIKIDGNPEDYELTYSKYDFTVPVKIKITKTEILQAEKQTINEEIMQNYNSHSGKFKDLLDNDLIDCENEFFKDACTAMDRSYHLFSMPVLSNMIRTFNFKPIVSNKKLNKLFEKLYDNQFGDIELNQYVKIMLKLPLEELDELYDVVMEYVKHHKAFAEFEDPIENYLKELSAK